MTDGRHTGPSSWAVQRKNAKVVAKTLGSSNASSPYAPAPSLPSRPSSEQLHVARCRHTAHDPQDSSLPRHQPAHHSQQTTRIRWAVCQVDRLRRTLPPSIRKVLNDLPNSRRRWTKLTVVLCWVLTKEARICPTTFSIFHDVYSPVCSSLVNVRAFVLCSLFSSLTV